MADRRVERTGKGADGYITRLCGSWGSASQADAIDHIEYRLHRYYVHEPGTRRAEVLVVRAPLGGGKYLRTEPDADLKNNLDNLPDC